MIIRRQLGSSGASLGASVNFNSELKFTDVSADALHRPPIRIHRARIGRCMVDVRPSIEVG
jgi:hypothetical protein